MSKRQIADLIKYGRELLLLNKKVNGKEYRQTESGNDKGVIYYSECEDIKFMSFNWKYYYDNGGYVGIQLNYYDDPTIEFSIGLNSEMIDSAIYYIEELIEELSLIPEETNIKMNNRRIAVLEKSIEVDRLALAELKDK